MRLQIVASSPNPRPPTQRLTVAEIKASPASLSNSNFRTRDLTQWCVKKKRKEKKSSLPGCEAVRPPLRTMNALLEQVNIFSVWYAIGMRFGTHLLAFESSYVMYICN